MVFLNAPLGRGLVGGVVESGVGRGMGTQRRGGAEDLMGCYRKWADWERIAEAR